MVKDVCIYHFLLFSWMLLKGVHKPGHMNLVNWLVGCQDDTAKIHSKTV